MQKILLKDGWQMQKCGEEQAFFCQIPCSVYHVLQQHGIIEDPNYRENQYSALQLSEGDYQFTHHFSKPVGEHCELCFDGIDTIADIFLNGMLLGSVNNMHRRWRFDVTAHLQAENTLTVIIHSPLRYIAKKQAERPLWGVDSTIAGFPHIRKAHHMFGWDWGPQLPDMGIWRDVYLECWSSGKIEHTYYRQNHHDGVVELTALMQLHTEQPLTAMLRITAPDGGVLHECRDIAIHDGKATCTVTIAQPQLWWANGYGEQPLYTATVMLMDEQETVIDMQSERIGLRTVTIRQEPDAWGDTFCLHLNGKDIFAMGANVIPFDQILPRITKEHVEKQLEACIKANFNVVRIWGGGVYPDDDFYNYCDEHGLLVWQDFMFACANYLLTDEFWTTTEMEIRDNLLRLRNHASLSMWCGNNEIETSFENWGLPEDAQAKADYLELFEHRIPAIVEELDPQHFYWRSSPSAYGGCEDTDSIYAGDMHYWDVWHGLKPFTAFHELYYRFCSEYGFESVPNLKTLLTICDSEQGDLNLMSPVMEAHQKCAQGNEKLMFYLAQMMRYPESFEELIYSTQLMQAEYIRTCVEHMRRARGRCMGSVYWQLNDTNPVISWSSIDYCGRWKALQHYAKRFHAPVLLTADKDALFNISNETMQEVQGTIHWQLRNAKSEVVVSGSMPASCPALTAVNVGNADLGEYADALTNRFRMREYYLTFTLEQGNEVLASGSKLFVLPKTFLFQRPEIRTEITETAEHFAVTLSADAYVMAVCLDGRTLDIDFSDNWFDLHGGMPVTVTVPKTEGLTAEKLREELTVRGT